MIVLENVTVAFGRTLALDEIDVRLDPGITGVFGPNGSGKSTLLRTIAGLIKPSQGRIVIDGEGGSRRSEEIRQRIGYAGHNSGLYARLSLTENLELFASLYASPRDRIPTMIESLALGPHARKPIADLSAGSKRRAAVARALLHDPDILLLDEPYANVDDEAAEAISAAIGQWKSEGKTALVATHGAKKVRAYADSGWILQRGRLIRTGDYRPEGFTAR